MNMGNTSITIHMLKNAVKMTEKILLEEKKSGNSLAV